MSSPPIDLRSDTITRPSPAMRRAMAEAEVGDDVFAEDPTVNRLQAEAAELLGFEAALFVPSGTMGNAIAIRLLTRPGQEVLAESRSHVIRYELSGMAVLSGVMPRAVESADGHLTPQHASNVSGPTPYYCSRVALAVLENTHNLAGGTVLSLLRTREVIAACRAAGFAVHLDGARIWNAATALGVTERELAAGVDTLMVALSKGLGAPVGSLLLGSRDLIAEARTVRKLLGGGMRQAGILAAAGLVGLREERKRLAEDHENARLLEAALREGAGVDVASGGTNIVVARLGRPAAPLADALRERGLHVSVMDDKTLRVVTHRDVDRAACLRAVELLREVFG